MKRSKLNRVGPRTRKWQAAWRWLKPRLEKAGRTFCEFDFIPHECGGPLDPAHSKKRGKMVGDDIYKVAISCRNFHDVLDLKYSHEEMERTVLEAINRHGGLLIP